jgi:hypothetical protein
VRPHLCSIISFSAHTGLRILSSNSPRSRI